MAFRLDPDTMHAFGDALIVSELERGRYLSYYSQSTCNLTTHYGMNYVGDVIGLAFLRNGKSPHAVMLTLD